MNKLVVMFVVVTFQSQKTQGHGILNLPLSRSAAQSKNPGIANGGNPSWNVHSWFNNNVTFTGNATLTDDRVELLTACTAGGSRENHSDCSWTIRKGSPWRAPGTAKIVSPCGIIGGSKNRGMSGRDHVPNEDGRNISRNFPFAPNFTIPVWKLGSVVDVAWAIAINHGGGYSYRLCSVSDLTEECFQRTPLQFVDNTTDIVSTDGTVLHTIAATRTNVGTFPAGSQWTKNPIPLKPVNFPEAAPGLSGKGAFQWNLRDRVKVPQGLPPGDYVLSWRWDCEFTIEVWANCADVRLVNSDNAA